MPKTTFRLGSVVPDGCGGPEASAISLVYSYLICQYNQTYFSFIHINQIGEDLQEGIFKETKKIVHVNIKHPVLEDFDNRPHSEKNLHRLQVANAGLLKLAALTNQLDVQVLDSIRKEILRNDFNFQIKLKSIASKYDKNWIADLVVVPTPEHFDYFVSILIDGIERCRLHFFRGMTDLNYCPRLFSKMVWQTRNLVVLSGSEKEVNIRISVEECKVEIINLTTYSDPPLFQMMRVGISEDQKQIAYENWLHSLPPSHAAILRKAWN